MLWQHLSRPRWEEWKGEERNLVKTCYLAACAQNSLLAKLLMLTDTSIRKMAFCMLNTVKLSYLGTALKKSTIHLMSTFLILNLNSFSNMMGNHYKYTKLNFLHFLQKHLFRAFCIWAVLLMLGIQQVTRPFRELPSPPQLYPVGSRKETIHN